MLSFWEKNSFINYDFVIIGSGILGLSTACEIKEKNSSRSVLVLEKGILPSGASTRNAGFACFGSLTEILSDFERIGEEETVSLVEKRYEGINLLRKRLNDERIGFLNYGGYELIDEKHLQAIDKISFVNKKLKNIFKADTFEVKNGKIKKFGFNESEVKSVVYSSFESQIDTGKMMSSLIDYTSSLGVRIINGCEVETLSEKENYVKVITKNNSGKEEIKFNAKSVIICTNAFTNILFPEMNVLPGRGQVIVTKPIEGLKIKGVYHLDEGFYYFRNFETRIIFGGGRNLDFEKENTTEFELNEKILNNLKDKLDKIILPNQKYEIDFCWSGIMGFNEIKRPVIKKISDRIIFALSCNGMGIALSPFISKEIVKKFNV
ncbi:MAG: FAD-binding oxidoreductase [Bacteroidota bacterium]|nr:FAD-binding oxidoreductase [Bacteroidota bacterium]